MRPEREESMTELDQVLGALRDEYEPDADARHRVRRALAASLVAGTVAGASKVTAAATAASAQGGASTGAATQGAVTGAGGPGALASASGKVAVGGWLKVIAGTGAAAVLATSAALLVPSGPTQSARPIDNPSPPALQGLASTTTTDESTGPEVAPVEDSDVEVPADTGSLEPASPELAPATLPKARKVPVEKPASTKTSHLMEELRLIRVASQAIRAGDTAKARHALDEHRRRFPKSALSHERRGLDLLAQCSGGQGAALRARAQKFVATNPESPLAQSIRARCLK